MCAFLVLRVCLSGWFERETKRKPANFLGPCFETTHIARNTETSGFCPCLMSSSPIRGEHELMM